MKKIFKILLIIIIMIPIFATAKVYTYNEAIDKVNSYIMNYENYNNYIELNNMPYNYEKNKVINHNNYKKGGLLSKDEYIITNIKNNSYLSTGLEYWTLSQHSVDKNYIIGHTLLERKLTDKTDIRVTQYVKPNVKIHGSGTKNNPWYFKEMKNINLYVVNDERGELGEYDCNNKSDKITIQQSDNDSIEFYVCPKKGYKYYNSSCKTNISRDNVDNNKFIFSGEANDNIICSIEFMYDTDKITTYCDNCRKQSEPNTFYISKNRDLWFKDMWGFESLTNLVSIPEKKGYIFQGYYTQTGGSGIQVINKNGEFVSTNIPNNILEDYKIYAHWIPITYTVVFDPNGGSGSMQSITCTYDQECNLPLNEYTKNNSYFMGWTKTKETTSSNTGTSLDKYSYRNNSNVSNLAETQGSSVTIYAKWLSCQTGTLTNNPSKGFVCVSSSQKYSYDCNCSTCTSYYTCMTSSGGCGSYSRYSYSCVTGSYSCCKGTYVKHDAVCRVWGTCNTYGTCTGTRYNDAPCYGTCSSSYTCNCSTCYACNSGWTTYSGSGSSLSCYKGTIIN